MQEIFTGSEMGHKFEKKIYNFNPIIIMKTINLSRYNCLNINLIGVTLDSIINERILFLGAQYRQ